MGQPEHTALEARLEVQKLNELPAMSLVAQQFLAAIADSNTEISQLAHIIERDPALLARIIGVANSAYFSCPEPVTTAEEAIFKVLGLQTTKSLVLAIILSGPFDAGRCPDFHVEKFWLESIFTATLAQNMAPLIAAEDKPSAGEAYLAGLLHKIGLLAMVHLYPGTMQQVFAELRHCCNAQELQQREFARLAVNHSEVGSWLSRKWHLPTLIVDVMGNYLNPHYDGAYRSLVQLVGFCSRWATAAVYEGSDEEYPCLSELQAVGIDVAHAGKKLGKVALKLEELRDLARHFSKG
jgi:HD-like signal output (HDOD) protein